MDFVIEYLGRGASKNSGDSAVIQDSNRRAVEEDDDQGAEDEGSKVISSKAMKMRAVRANPHGREERLEKNRGYQSTLQKKRKALSAVGEVALDAGLAPQIFSAMPVEKKEKVYADLVALGFNVDLDAGGTSHIPNQIYCVEVGRYLLPEPCKHCATKCSYEVGFCDPKTCICYNSNMVCDHSFCCPATPFFHHTQPLEIKTQGGMGDGAFATRNYPAGYFLGAYTGVFISKQKAEKIIAGKSRHIYLMALPRALQGKRGSASTMYINGEKGNETRFINHSCDPNVCFQMWEYHDGTTLPRIAVYTTKAIKQGEPLGADYGWSRCHLRSRKCACGSSKCKGII
jgi:uncharacterized protein